MKILNKKKQGFQGQKAISIPRKILSSKGEKSAIISALSITDIGYYPKAQFHYRQRQHGSDQHIFIYCIEGKGWVEIDKTRYQIRAGVFFIIPRHVPHTYAADETDPWTIYWLHFKGTVSDEIVTLMLAQHSGNKGFAPYNDARVGIFNRIYSLLERGYGENNLVNANMSIWQYFTTFVFQEKLVNSGKFARYDVIEKAIDYMSKSVDKVVTLEDIAGTVSLSPSHFSTYFKKKTGFSPIEYMNHLKVQKACQYLSFSDLRVKEISFQLGIDDPYYFSRLFNKVMGISPIQYRDRKKI